MPKPLTRRRAVALGVGGLAELSLFGTPTRGQSAGGVALASLERRSGGRLGVHAVDTGSGRVLAHRGDEPFLMCSTVKTLVVAAALARVDSGADTLATLIPYGARDLLDYAPVTRAHVAEGDLPIEALCAAAIEFSDNTAANLLEAHVGGPPAATRFLRGLGDKTTRVDRSEPDLNTAAGPLDTTTPRAMAESLRALLLGDVLSKDSRARLESWLVASSTGARRLRAAFPRDWRIGDKTGTAGIHASDVAFIRPPGRPPVFVAAYCEAAHLDGATREAVLRDVGALVRVAFA